MSERLAFERVLASLYAARLDDTRWPATSALIDEACGVVGNALLVGEGPPDDIRVLFVGLYYRGQRRPDLEREHLDVLPSHQRSHPAPAATARRPSGASRRPVHGRGTAHLAYLQRGITPVPVSAGRERAPGRAGGLPHDLVARGSRRFGWLGVVADRHGQTAHASHPSIHPCPAGTGPRPGGGHDRDCPAREPSDRRPPPGPAGADPGGE